MTKLKRVTMNERFKKQILLWSSLTKSLFLSWFVSLRKSSSDSCWKVSQIRECRNCLQVTFSARLAKSIKIKYRRSVRKMWGHWNTYTYPHITEDLFMRFSIFYTRMRSAGEFEFVLNKYMELKCDTLTLTTLINSIFFKPHFLISKFICVYIAN
jgi:hypothetical protein